MTTEEEIKELKERLAKLEEMFNRTLSCLTSILPDSNNDMKFIHHQITKE